jgi:hypothetical protein
MPPRFLYGDSQPFPGGYDFLAALKQYVAAAAQALALTSEADELERSLGDKAQEHLYAIEALQAFFESVESAISDRTARSGAAQIVGPYATELLTASEQIHARAKSLRARDLDGASGEVTARIRERRAQIRAVIADYLLHDPLPVLSWALSLNLVSEPVTGQVELEHPANVSSSFTLEIARDPNWSRPRRLGDLAPGMVMQVGFKKAFLRSSLHPDVVTLDEMVISSLELGPDSLELHLRRRGDAPRDAFVLSIDPDEAGSTVRITRFDERSGGSEPPFESTGEEAQRVHDLAAVLRGECAALLAHKKRLLSAQLDGHDVFERGLVPTLLTRIGERLAPTAAEVSRHSPNPDELSLKIEREGGRREEVYLRKAELIALVAPLSPESQQLFSRLAFLPASAEAPRAPQRVEPASVEVDVEAPEPTMELTLDPAGAPASRPSAIPPPRRKW